LEVDRLKQVLRRSVTGEPSRRENSAEHSWHVALMAVVLAEHAAASIDLLRVVKMLLIHDIVEVDAGDTFIYDSASKLQQHERELLAAERIFPLLPAAAAGELHGLWLEFEAAESAEARFAKALDRLQPILLNWQSGGAGWRKHRITAAQVAEINRPIATGAPGLWHTVTTIIEDALGSGALTS
jgi:putative hydrolase of HD superfamily